jgi:2-C-methyl-D-erythritol 4-phosphate cytidylyltransferase
MSEPLGAIMLAHTPGADFDPYWADLHGLPVVAHAVAGCLAAPQVRAAVMVVAIERVEMTHALAQKQGWQNLSIVACHRPLLCDALTVGLAHLPPDIVTIVIHDGARPGVTPELIAAVVDGLGAADAASAAVPLTETIKQVNDAGLVVDSPDRAALCTIQTPQASARSRLVAALAVADPAPDAPDVAWLIEHTGGTVRLVPGAYTNLRVTTPDDLIMVQAFGEAPRPAFQS